MDYALDLHFTRTGDLGSLPSMVKGVAGADGIRRIEKLVEVPAGTFNQPLSTVLYTDNYKFFSLASDMLGLRSVSLNMTSSDDARNLGVYGRYLLSAPNFHTGLRRAVSIPRRNRRFSFQTLEYQGDLVRFGYRCRYQGSAHWRHQADLMATYMVAMLMHYTKSLKLLRHIEVSHPKGPYEQDLEDRFGVPVLFGKKADAIVFDRSALGKASPDYTISWASVTLRDVELEKLPVPSQLPSQIRMLISQRLLGQRSDLEGLATRVGIGPRTLQRRLSEFGTSYRELLEAERRARALYLLEDGSISVDNIAFALGYATRTQFIRAFKGWTGVSPRKFRNNWFRDWEQPSVPEC